VPDIVRTKIRRAADELTDSGVRIGHFDRFRQRGATGLKRDDF
jgi:hypothetical protein